MDTSSTRQQFLQAVQKPDAQIDLAKSALLIAQEAYPDLEIEHYLNRLDGMADQVRSRLPAERYPLRIIQTINHYLYTELGFQGNTTDYYDPRNSFLNEVLDRRLGIPITLALVYLEIARRIDFPMVDVGMPGHLLIRPHLPEMEIFVDPFYQGEILFAEDCQERLSQIYGQPVPLEPQFLTPLGPRKFLGRMLTNLKMIYLERGEAEPALASIERLLILFPQAPLEHRDRGLLLYHLQRWPEACQDLEFYLGQVPEAADRGMIEHLVDRMRQVLG